MGGAPTVCLNLVELTRQGLECVDRFQAARGLVVLLGGAGVNVFGQQSTGGVAALAGLQQRDGGVDTQRQYFPLAFTSKNMPPPSACFSPAGLSPHFTCLVNVSVNAMKSPLIWFDGIWLVPSEVP